MKKIIITIFTIFILLFTGCAPTESADMTFTGMGTVISCKIYGEDSKLILNCITEEFDRIDNACSLTKEDSEINKLNKTGSTDNAYLVEQAKLMEKYGLSDISEGRFDITVGALTSLWNIGFENAKKPDEKEIENALSLVDCLKTSVSDSFIIAEGQKVDLGAVTKGYALDRAKEILDANNADSAVVTVGGSVLFYGKNPTNKNWTCAVKSPFDTSEYLGVFTLEGGFVSTSGSYERFFTEENKTYHHIIDATTGYPAESEFVSVTVICDNGFLSDALSTVCFMAGKEKGKEILEKYNAQGIFVEKDGNVTVVGDIEFEAY